MEKHPECNLCVHDTMLIAEDGSELMKYCNGSKKDMDYDGNDIIAAGGGGLFHTSSFFMKRKVIFERPEEFIWKEVGDYPMAMYASMDSTIHFISKSMSCYRTNSVGSRSSIIFS